jgi:NADH-quinone oxidoreductase subunit L
MGAYVGGMFHLLTHAFFKALLFLSAGSVILGMERGHHHLAHSHEHDNHSGNDVVFDPGDMRNMGGLRKQMPVTFWLYLIGAVALAGIPPFAGFWSKDEILAEASQHFPLAYWLLTAAAFLTAFYMGRQIWLVFFGQPRHEVAEHAQESPLVMTVPLMVLAALAVLGGGFNIPQIPLGGMTLPGFPLLNGWLGKTVPGITPGTLNWLVAGLSTLLALVAIGISWLLYQRKPLAAGQPDPLKRFLGPLFTVFENKYWVDELYKLLVVNGYVNLAHFLAQTVDWDFWHDWFHDAVLSRGFVGFTRFLADPIDRGVVDRVFSAWPAAGTQWLSAKLRPLQNGFVRSYALFVVLGVVAIIGYLLLK